MVDPLATTVGPARGGRSRLLAALLTLVMPGLGHAYAGRVRRGVVVWILGWVVGALALLTIIHPPWERLGIAIGPALLLVYTLASAVDAAHCAGRNDQPFAHGVAARWGLGSLAVLASGGLSLLALACVKAEVAELYRIASASMEPTLEVGDRVLVQKAAYSTSSGPQRGDIVAYELERVVYVKRVLGSPGDRVGIRDGVTFVNGLPLEEPYLDADPRRTQPDMAEVLVPAGRYFVAGDNRAFSRDSRQAEHGTVPSERILGRATVILWSPHGSRSGLRLR